MRENEGVETKGKTTGKNLLRVGSAPGSLGQIKLPRSGIGPGSRDSNANAVLLLYPYHTSAEGLEVPALLPAKLLSCTEHIDPRTRQPKQDGGTWRASSGAALTSSGGRTQSLEILTGKTLMV